MIREVIAQAWAESPAKVIAAVLLAPVAVAYLWLLTAFAIIAGTPA